MNSNFVLEELRDINTLGITTRTQITGQISNLLVEEQDANFAVANTNLATTINTNIEKMGDSLFLGTTNQPFEKLHLITASRYEEQSNLDIYDAVNVVSGATIASGQKGKQFQFDGNALNVQVYSRFLYPRIHGAKMLYLFPIGRGESANSWGSNLVAKFGLNKFGNNGTYSYWVFDTSAGNFRIEYKYYNTTLVIQQSGFNIDKLDGTGSSGLLLQIERVNIFWIMEDNFNNVTLFGVLHDGKYIPAHKLTFTNILSWNNAATFRNRHAIILSGSGNINSHLSFETIACYSDMPLYESIRNTCVFRSSNLNTSTLGIGLDGYAFLIKFNGTTRRANFQPNKLFVYPTTGAVLVQCIRYAEENGITYTGGTTVTVGSMTLVDNPTSLSINPPNLLFSRVFDSAGEIDLHQLMSWKILGYNHDYTLSDVLAFRMFNLGALSVDIHKNISWYEF